MPVQPDPVPYERSLAARKIANDLVMWSIRYGYQWNVEIGRH